VGLATRLAGREGVADRLLQSLSVDDTETRRRLGWLPRVGLDEGVAATCRWFRGADRAAADSAPGRSRL
jgi:nucleoside-diphosphate-sugar epimerase